MTDEDLKARVASAIANAPKAERPPPARPIDIKVKLLTMYLRMSATTEARMRYARELVAAKRERGDFEAVIQGPMQPDLIEALVKHEAQASVQNLEGERHD